MKTLLYTTTAFVLCGGIVQANAACIATPSCTAMGYTSTSSCTNGIKCPFGNYWNCDLANKIAELEKKIDQQQQQESCVVGSILYSDKSCSSNLMLGKTPIGIVVYLGPSGYQALALESIGSYDWTSEEYIDISTLPIYSSKPDASKDYDSCGNTAKIIAAGDKSKYPAAWAAHEYKTEGTQAGDWCLPAAGIFTSVDDNHEAINTGYSRANGTQFTSGAWSSSKRDSYYAWYSYFSGSYGLGSGNDGNYENTSREVRPVLEWL